MFEDYSGFYYNKQGLYENIVFYITPPPNQRLYMIRKMGVMLDTVNVLKSIETGFNGYDYEIYECILKSQPVDNPDDDDETIVLVDFGDFSNQQLFEGVVIIDKAMPMYDRLYDYLYESSKGLPFLTEGRDPKNKLISETPPTTNIPKQETPAPSTNTVVVPEENKVDGGIEVFNEIDETPAPKTFNEQLMTPQQRAIEDSQTLAFQIVQNNEEINNGDNNQ